VKTEKIAELWNNNLIDAYNDEIHEYDKEFTFNSFQNAINQAELEIYREVIDNLRQVNMQSDVKEYIREIQNKIKELEK
jgi:hypothetical protein